MIALAQNYSYGFWTITKSSLLHSISNGARFLTQRPCSFVGMTTLISKLRPIMVAFSQRITLMRSRDFRIASSTHVEPDRHAKSDSVNPSRAIISIVFRRWAFARLAGFVSVVICRESSLLWMVAVKIWRTGLWFFLVETPMLKISQVKLSRPYSRRALANGYVGLQVQCCLRRSSKLLTVCPTQTLPSIVDRAM